MTSSSRRKRQITVPNPNRVTLPNRRIFPRLFGFFTAAVVSSVATVAVADHGFRSAQRIPSGNTANRAVYSETVQSTGEQGRTLTWRPATRQVSHETATSPRTAQMRSVIAQREEVAPGGPFSNPMNNPFGDAALEPEGTPMFVTPPGAQQLNPPPAGAFDSLPPASLPTPPATREPARIDAGSPQQEIQQPSRIPANGLMPNSSNGLQRQPASAEEGCTDADAKECKDALAALKANKLADINLDIRIFGNEGVDFPCECPLGTDEVFSPRMWESTVFTWKASALCHKPLYFEEVHLERYGHSWGPFLDPAVSAAHFFVALPILPYKMGVQTPNECVYTLGYYRPGNCAPYMIDPIPFSARGALFQTGAVFGVGAMFP